MVKLHCDRCGKEIVGEHYYTIDIRREEVYPKFNINDLANAISTASYSTEKGLFEELNSRRMYCDNCKEQIEEFIYGNDEFPWI